MSEINLQAVQAIINDLKNNPVEKSGDIYHPIPFDEFRSLRTSSKPASAYRKWGLIRQTLTPQNFQQFRVLDVGANAGFYSYQFAKEGATVDAYEPTQRYANLGAQIAELYQLPIHWYGKALDLESLAPTAQYNVALMLSVFQWISQGNARLEEAKQLLLQISKQSQTLFFELGCNYGKSAIQTNANSLLWVRQLLAEHTIYPHIAYLGSVRAWRWRGVRYLFACSIQPLQLNTWQRLVTSWLNRRINQ